MLFTGARHTSPVPLGITPREQFAVMTLAVLILGGGLWPQWNVASRSRAADVILQDRNKRQSPATAPAPHEAHADSH